jgi:hypothetical protein
MKCGVLIIGSLRWDENPKRRNWRESLDLGAQKFANAPIFYGRISAGRGSTYTMTFHVEEPRGTAVLLPCKENISSFKDLQKAAINLWKAEALREVGNSIASTWGSVGVLFRDEQKYDRLLAEWQEFYKTAGKPFEKEKNLLTALKDDGRLSIAWPKYANGSLVDLDIILATVTKPEAQVPTAATIADAWIEKCGYQEYFFNNVLHGIRTADDLVIWERIEKMKPDWLSHPKYEKAIEQLRSDVSLGT